MSLGKDFNKFWLELPPEVFLQLHSPAGLSDAQLKVVVTKAFKAGMVTAQKIMEDSSKSLGQCFATLEEEIEKL